MEFKHEPVLLEETINGLNIKPNGIYVDGTLGGAGHSKKILKQLSSKGLLVGIDRDEEALKAAKENLKEFENVKYIHGNHDEITEILESLDIKEVDGETKVTGPEFDIDVNVAELLGNEYYVHADFGGTELVSKIPANRVIKTGDKIKVFFDLKKIHFFDPETEKSI